MLLILIVTFCCAIISYIKIKNDTENHNIRIINKILFIISGNIFMFIIAMVISCILWEMYIHIQTITELDSNASLYLFIVTLCILLIRGRNLPGYYFKRFLMNIFTKEESEIITSCATSIFCSTIKLLIYLVGFISALILNTITLKKGIIISEEIKDIADIINYAIITIIAFDTSIETIICQKGKIIKEWKKEI
ncbi:hypothetical protein [Treponema sp. OMZ 838]|uniref:hypothetical protein n=2 Tax=unclassified Treponema TaxID=2638727 RepID=UPI001F25ABE2|nr:hypothetical protein [Treponema sp. OMZ 838]